MPFIGNQPAEKYSAFQKQDFTTSATTSYTLDHPVANQNEIALFINFVRQEPTTAYTASGTSLTLTSATASSDDMYCVFLGKAVQTVNPPSGSVGSSQVASTIITGQTAETSIATDDTILIHDTSASALRKMTRANFVSGIGGTNTPAFGATQNSVQAVSNTTWTELTNYGREVFDTDNNFASNRFTPTTAGKYFFYASTFKDNISAESYIALSKNGATSGTSDNFQMFRDNGGSNYGIQVSGFFDMNGSSDYVSVFVYQQSGSNQNYGNTNHSFARFTGYKLIGA